MSATLDLTTDTDDEEFSYSSSSDDEQLNLGEGGIQPYQFEPIQTKDTRISNNSDYSHDDAGCGLDLPARLQTSDWCTCGNCVVMDTALECLCCQEVPPAIDRMDRASKTCITEVEGFRANCLDIDVLETSFYDYLATEHGPLGEDEEIHKMYRYVAYRRFTRYIWKLLGHKIRKVIPACAVNIIRTRFPSEQYTNFKYPRP